MKDFRKKIIIYSLIFDFIFFFPLLILSIHFYYFIKVPYNKEGKLKVVDIPKGSGIIKISKILEKEKIISHPLYFQLLAYYSKVSKKIKAGEYEISSAMLPTEILDMMVKGKVKTYSFTIPEGYNIYQIASIIEENKIGSYKEFIDLVTDPSFIKELGIEESSLEGYLFPDTYFYNKSTSLKEIITNMVNNFKRVTSDIKINSDDLSFREIIILASIIEKETGVEEERRLISAIFKNRLKKHMRLESDPTVIYGLGNFNKKLTKEDLKTYSPYNTYIIYGLPPSPISNPGKASILAALNPVDEGYLYFVSKNDGTHFFSKNYQDHLKAVRIYQKNK